MDSGGYVPGGSSFADVAADLSADLSAALAVDLVESRPNTGERHVCVRPVAARKVEHLDIDAVQGLLGPDPNIQYDWFQKTAFACVDLSDSVLVAAPTSAGKTAVALHAIRRCMAEGRRCVYTAPIKALSNEKFGDFVKEFSAEDVALLTGDARAGRLETAKIVVMTTEVLVSLLHNEAMLEEDVEDVSSRSELMQSLSCAIFDEIHYIADEERGTAWEECIVLLERHVQLIGLSATVPNFMQLAAWIAQTRHVRRMQDQLEMVITKQLQQEDRQLQSIREGVGLHHGGLLPVLREITEQFFKDRDGEGSRGHVGLAGLDKFAGFLAGDGRYKIICQNHHATTTLFQRWIGPYGIAVTLWLTWQEGLIRALCTTETFAVGVNMPSRSILFNWFSSKEFHKFDGTDQRWMFVSEACLRLRALCFGGFRKFASSERELAHNQERHREVLVSQGYVGESRRLTQKGRAAALLEMRRELFRPSIMNYLVAFLSCFVNDLEEAEEAGDQSTSSALLNQLRRRATFVTATFKWMSGDCFEECSDAAGGSEYDGILARVLRRTHLMLKQLDLAFQLPGRLHAVGPGGTWDQVCCFHRGSARQSLPFLESLYLPLAFEPDTLDPSFLRQQEKPCPYNVGDEVLMSPAEIGFSHFSISAHFRDGNTIASTLQQLMNKEIRKEDIEIVYWTENKFWCLSNRRLAVFRLYQQRCPEDGGLIPVKMNRSVFRGMAILEALDYRALARCLLVDFLGLRPGDTLDCQETYFDFSWDAGEGLPPEEVFDETGFQRADRPPDMPDMDRELNADESEDRMGCYRFGLVHTTPKSKYPLLLVTQRTELPSCSAYEETELHYGDVWKAMEDLRLCHHGEVLKVEFVTPNGMAWNLGVREGMTATKADGWDRADSLDGGDEDGVTIVIRGNQRFWRLTMLQSNVMSAIRIATALSEPENHLPVFWQKQISGNPDGSAFGGVSEERCAAMRSGEDLEEMGLNESQADAVSSLVQCPHGVRLVQGPPGWQLRPAQQQFPTLLVDEACQACEAETLPALRTTVQRMFLVGDPRQLPATIASPNAKRAGYGRSMTKAEPPPEGAGARRFTHPGESHKAFREEDVGGREGSERRNLRNKGEESVSREPQGVEFSLGRTAGVMAAGAWAARWEIANMLEHGCDPALLVECIKKGEEGPHVLHGEAPATSPSLNSFSLVSEPNRGGRTNPPELTGDAMRAEKAAAPLPVAKEALGNEKEAARAAGLFDENKDDWNVYLAGQEAILSSLASKSDATAWVSASYKPLKLLGAPSAGKDQKIQTAKCVLDRTDCSNERAVLQRHPQEQHRFGPFRLYRAQLELLEALLATSPMDRSRVTVATVDGFQGNERLSGTGSKGGLDTWSSATTTVGGSPSAAFATSSSMRVTSKVPWLRLAGLGLRTRRAPAEQLVATEVLQIEDGSLLAQWNASVPNHRLPWVAEERPTVEVGHRILEVEGLVGDQALEVAQQGAQKLRMTVAFPRPDEVPPPEEVPPDEADGSDAPVSDGEVGGALPPGGSGFRWEALWDGIKAKEGFELNTAVVCELNKGDVVVQSDKYVTLNNGLIRMPIRTPIPVGADFDGNDTCWVTLDARPADPFEGRLFFKAFAHEGSADSLWRCQERAIIKRGPDMRSEPWEEIGSGTVVTQASAECQWVEGCLRMPIKIGERNVGWVTLDARARGGPLFFQYLAPLEGGLWRALSAAKPRAGYGLDTPPVKPWLKRGDIVRQSGRWIRLEDGKVRLPIQREQGTVWVMLLSDGETPEPWVELVGMRRAA
eukprot:Skav219111  [mRNA]  locus=scaffold1574:326424:353022:+ [translate_table: standard]